MVGLQVTRDDVLSDVSTYLGNALSRSSLLNPTNPRLHALKRDRAQHTHPPPFPE